MRDNENRRPLGDGRRPESTADATNVESHGTALALRLPHGDAFRRAVAATHRRELAEATYVELLDAVVPSVVDELLTAGAVFSTEDAACLVRRVLWPTYEPQRGQDEGHGWFYGLRDPSRTLVERLEDELSDRCVLLGRLFVAGRPVRVWGASRELVLT